MVPWWRERGACKFKAASKDQHGIKDFPLHAPQQNQREKAQRSFIATSKFSFTKLEQLYHLRAVNTSACSIVLRVHLRVIHRSSRGFVPGNEELFVLACSKAASSQGQPRLGHRRMGGVLGTLFGGHRRAVGRPAPDSRHRAQSRQPSAYDAAAAGGHRRKALAKKYSFIPDTYKSLEQVAAALREQGLESSNLILGIDFTKSNEWTGKRSFRGQSLHRLGDTPNPYEQAISIIGKTLAPFDEDNLIPCFGFGDATTHDYNVFSFHPDNSPCHGFEEVLACYRKIVPHLKLSGPTSFAPIVEAAVDIVDRSGGQYHVLVIVADGQVTRSVDTSEGDLSPQEKKTVDSIVMASSYPLSIVLVGVGDGPWEDMQKFDDKLPARDFDNFQFVNFTSIMARSTTPQQKESAFALAALMEVPIQYRATVELGILGRSTGKAKRVVPAPPPLPLAQMQASLRRGVSNVSAAAAQPAAPREDQVCPICLTNAKDLAFGCGHTCCRECGENLTRCPICRQAIRSRLRLYSG